VTDAEMLATFAIVIVVSPVWDGSVLSTFVGVFA
jgi:hypothetical protein